MNGHFMFDCQFYIIVTTGPPTHSVGYQTSNARWRLSASVTLHGTV